MRKTLFAGLMIIVFLSVPLTNPAISETTSDDVAKKTEEAWHSFNAYLIEKKKDAVEYGKELMKKADDEIESLETKAADASGKAEKDYQEEVKSVKKKRDIAEKKLDELGKASEDSWDSAKKDFADAYKELYESYKEILAKFN